MEDSQIVDLYWERNEQAIRAAASKYGDYCYSIAYNILRSREDADESVNDTYLGAWNAMPPHRPNCLRTFLGKITRRVSLKKWRDEHRDKRGGDEVSLALEELSECIPSNASVFLCRYWYLDSIDKISADFCFGKSKVKSMLRRTRARLRADLEKEGVL